MVELPPPPINRCDPTSGSAEGCHAMDLERIREAEADDPDCE
jgi:hypothetical protein